MKVDWSGAYVAAEAEQFIGARTAGRIIRSRRACRAYIDWTPFFQTWELAGRFPAILDDAKVGEAARSLYNDARKMLDKHRQAENAGSRHCGGHGLLAGQCRRRRHHCVCRRDAKQADRGACIRCASNCQSAKAATMALSDFMAPRDSGLPDYIGAFVVTAGIGEDVIAERFKNAQRRLFGDHVSRRWRIASPKPSPSGCTPASASEFWGYAPDETATPDQLILEQVCAASAPRPAIPRSPITPRRRLLFRLLDAENTAGVKLTESFAMWPGSSVSGLYFSHPDELLFRRRQDRARPGRGLRRPQGHERGRDRALAGAGAELHSLAAGKGSNAAAGAGQRRRYPSARLQLRRASGLAQEGGRGVGASRSAACLSFSPCGRRWREAPDEGSLSAEADPSPVSNELRSFDPPSPTRGEGKKRE